MAQWKYQVDIRGIYYNSELTLSERAGQIADRIAASSWFTAPRDEMDVVYLEALLDDLRAAKDQEDYKEFLDALYDLADAERCWFRSV